MTKSLAPTRRASLALALAALAPAAVAQADELPLHERLGEAWRWRDVAPPPGVQLERVAPWGADGIVAADRTSLRRFDGLSWTSPPEWSLRAGERIEGLAAVAAGVVVLTDARVLLLDEDGVRRGASRPPGFPASFPPIELPDVGLVFLGERDLLRLERTGLAAWRPAPRGAGALFSLAAAPDGSVLCSTATGVQRLEGERWRELPAPAGVEHGFASALNVGGEVVFHGGAGAPKPTCLIWDGAALVERVPLFEQELDAAVATPEGAVITSGKVGGLQVCYPDEHRGVEPPVDEGERTASMCLTRAGRLVVLTVGGRLRSCEVTSRRWRSWLPMEDELSEANTVNAIARASRGGLWLGTSAGVARWDEGRIVERHREAAGVRLEGVTALAEDPYGSLWVGSGSRFRGALQYDGERWAHHVEEQGVGPRFVHAIRRAPTGELWFLLLGDFGEGSDPGGAVELTSMGWRRHVFEGHPLDSRVYDVDFDAAGRPLLATFSRVWRRGARGWEVLGGEGAEALNDAPVKSVHFDGARVWLGHGLALTGLQFYEGGEWIDADLPGLSRACGGDFAQGPDGVLWIASNRGLHRWDGELGTAPADEPNAPTRVFWPVLADADRAGGGVWLGAKRLGLVRYLPDDFDPPIVRDVQAWQDSESESWVARWTGRDRWNRTPEDELRFRVRVDGGAWSLPMREDLVPLGRLGDGEHVVEVQAVDLAGNRSATLGTTRIVVAAPFLRAWGPLVALLLAGAAGGLALVHVRRAERRRGLEERERRATEASERHYRTLVNRADMVLVCFGPDGDLEYVSPYVEHLTGYTPEAFLADEELPQRCLVAEDRPLHERLVTARRSRSLAVLDAELRVRHRDGSVRWVYVKQSPRQDPRGELVGYDALAYEVTERKALEEALRESEEQSRSIVETCNEGVWMLDTRYRTRYVNQRMAALLGETGEALRGRPMAEFLGEENMALVRETFERSRTGNPAQCQVRIRGARGEERWAILGASCIHAPGGEEVGLLAMLADVTDRKQAEEALQRSQRLESLGLLAGGVAHDFNNLLMVVQGNCELALRRIEIDSGAQEYLQKIEQASNRAAELCLQMLAYTGRGTLEARRVSPGSLVAGMERLLASSVSARVLLELELARDLPDVRADPTQLRQVVMNLVLNGSEAIGDGVGQVTVRVFEGDAGEGAEVVLAPARPAERHVVIEVSDTGRGMDEETRDRIFDPFFSTSGTGRGLGLAAVHGIVRAHGGGLAVRTRPGRGSTLRVSLPVVPDPVVAPPAEPALADEPREGWRGSGTVLLVDDEPMVRLVAKDQLEALGFDVLVAETGREALEVFEAHRTEVRVVLLDMLLPDMNGVQVWRAIARLRPDVPVLLASGYSAGDVAARFEGDGPHGFLQKPYRMAELARKLQGLLSR